MITRLTPRSPRAAGRAWWRRGATSPCRGGRRALSGWRIIWGISSSIGDVPLHDADGDGAPVFFCGLSLTIAAGAVVAEPGDDDAVAGLEAGAGVGDPGVGLGLALEVAEALVERLARSARPRPGRPAPPAGRPRRPCGASGRWRGRDRSPPLAGLEVARRAGDEVLGQVRAAARSASRSTGRCRRCAGDTAAGASPGRTRRPRSRPGGCRTRRSSGRRCAS